MIYIEYTEIIYNTLILYYILYIRDTAEEKAQRETRASPSVTDLNKCCPCGVTVPLLQHEVIQFTLTGDEPVIKTYVSGQEAIAVPVRFYEKKRVHFRWI